MVVAVALTFVGRLASTLMSRLTEAIQAKLWLDMEPRPALKGELRADKLTKNMLLLLLLMVLVVLEWLRDSLHVHFATADGSTVYRQVVCVCVF